jgi:hypothetical protein
MARTRKRLIVFLVCVVVIVGAWSMVAFVEAVLDVPKQAYAVWWTADLVIEYMEHHEGAWPKGWDDLRSVADGIPEITESVEGNGSHIVEFRPHASIEELQSLVEIDWNANPDELVKAHRKEVGPPFRVIYLRSGRSTHYEDREPNEMILAYLESRQRKPKK